MSETFQEHLELVEKVLSTLMHSEITVKVDQYEFAKSEVF